MIEVQLNNKVAKIKKHLKQFPFKDRYGTLK
jgi:hypothetical protein